MRRIAFFPFAMMAMLIAQSSAEQPQAPPTKPTSDGEVSGSTIGDGAVGFAEDDAVPLEEYEGYVQETGPAQPAQALDFGPTPVAPKIDCKDEYKLGEKTVIAAGDYASADAEVKLSWQTVVGIEDFEVRGEAGDQLYLWPQHAGIYKAILIATYYVETIKPGPKFPEDPTDLVKGRFVYSYPAVSREFRVIGGAAPPPGPSPDPIPPVVPVVPTPGTLAALVPDAATRLLISEFYADLSDSVRASVYVDVEHFRNAYRSAMLTAQNSGVLPKGIAAIDKPISDRLTVVTGLVPKAPVNSAALADALAAISAEFLR